MLSLSITIIIYLVKKNDKLQVKIDKTQDKLLSNQERDKENYISKLETITNIINSFEKDITNRFITHKEFVRALVIDETKDIKDDMSKQLEKLQADILRGINNLIK